MIRIEDLGEVAYGGAVTLTEWWDNKRIAAGKITQKQVLKKASFYTYLVPGIVATLASIFGWMPKWERWEEKVSTGFLYDVPRFAYNLVQTMSSTSSRANAESSAVAEAQKVMRQRQLLAEGAARRTTEQDLYVARPNPQPLLVGPIVPNVAPQTLSQGIGDLG